MLARRFTIVCLLTALFGMGFAIIVAEASRPTRDWETASPRNCTFCMNQHQRCATKIKEKAPKP